MTIIHIPLSVLWNSFSFFADELQAVNQLIGCVGRQPEKLSIAARHFAHTTCARMADTHRLSSRSVVACTGSPQSLGLSKLRGLNKLGSLAAT
ncbi:hypothetical protein JK621_18395 [Serratia plymuthica]|uniref:hypothetical protein n=1 Tax=Serratia plymuthica TaxID=82996 RepID=UPI001BB03BA3|nr:hypothetical protein [Serratia plymuthica]QUY47365.1 hypothetical protein JK621_18395 [Serratia plymuthica]